MKKINILKSTIFCILALLLLPVPSTAEEIRVLYGELPPYMYIKNNKPAGFYYDLLQEMLKEMPAIKIRYIHLPVKRMIHITRKEPNTMCLGLTRNPKREKLYKWVGPSIARRVCAFRLKSRHDLKLETTEDFKKFNFGVGLGFAAIQDLLALGVPMENIDESPIDSINVVKLYDHRIDYYASIDIVAVYNTRLKGYNWSDIHSEYILNDKYKLYYAFNKETKNSIISEFQQGLDKVKANGKWQKLVDIYSGKSIPDNK